MSPTTAKWLSSTVAAVMCIVTRRTFSRPIKPSCEHVVRRRKNRLLLAKLFQQPANLIVMDEPTNDLDAETLELLEEVIGAFNGTLLLVSHDRAFLNTSCKAPWCLRAMPVKEYTGGYDDYLAQRQPTPNAAKPPRQPKPKPGRSRQTQEIVLKEKRLLESLPGRIAELESEQEALQQQINDPDFFTRPHEETTAVTARLEALKTNCSFP